jgi:KaiC/GvpD/RAD55 family RecA-like ATPase
MGHHGLLQAAGHYRHHDRGSDTIIVLRYVEVGGDLKRAVGVLKMRGSDHDTSLHELLIDPPQLAVGPRLAAVNLSGAALRSL